MPEPRDFIQNSVRLACYAHLSTIGEQHTAALVVRHVLTMFEVPEDAASRQVAAEELSMLAEVIFGLAPSVTGQAHYRCAQVRQTLRGFAQSIERLEA